MRRIVLGVLLTLSLAPAAEAAFEGPPVEKGVTRPVILVGNNWDGTTDLVDPNTFERLDRIDVQPDRQERLDEISLDPVRLGFFIGVRGLVGEGHDQLNDDVFSSHDGRTIFVSRPSFADVVAIDVATKEIVWRTPVSGYRSDHMAISRDGTELLVSASTGNVVHRIDTATGKITGEVASGDSPHENVYSRDGSKVFHAAIGRVYTPIDMDEASVNKGEEFFQIFDARTMEVTERIDMGAELAEAGFPGMSSAVRPMALSPDERFLYFQVSFFHGFVEYDLQEKKVTRVADLPIPEKTRQIPREQYLLDSAHHGLAMDRRGEQLCVAGTMSDYGALVDRESFEVTVVDDSIIKPYWSTNSADGRHCYISGSGEDDVSVISYATKEVVHSFKVGYHPQRVRNGVVRLEQFPKAEPAKRFRVKVRGKRLRLRDGARTRCRSTTTLVRCLVTVRARGEAIAHGERYQAGEQRGLPVELKLVEGATVPRRAVVVARGVSADGRVAKVRKRVRVRG